ncbi:hypothetical protein NPIL_390951 [Nephila pilipes]|uniref:Uncharacterized protein n=1 Tax=Nephila pilipes TaxID=299642 RepID=A0A8X6P2V3_NEPPI|nr:hypothetical protein NPIL_390951 [Nephila pilipes]
MPYLPAPKGTLILKVKYNRHMRILPDIVFLHLMHGGITCCVGDDRFCTHSKVNNLEEFGELRRWYWQDGILRKPNPNQSNLLKYAAIDISWNGEQGKDLPGRTSSDITKAVTSCIENGAL